MCIYISHILAKACRLSKYITFSQSQLQSPSETDSTASVFIAICRFGSTIFWPSFLQWGNSSNLSQRNITAFKYSLWPEQKEKNTRKSAHRSETTATPIEAIGTHNNTQNRNRLHLTPSIRRKMKTQLWSRRIWNTFLPKKCFQTKTINSAYQNYHQKW